MPIGDFPWIGPNAGGTGVYKMTGGTLSTPKRPLSVGRYGTGTLDVSGSAVVTASNGIRVGYTDNSGTGNGTLVVTNGGTIVTTSIYGGGNTAAQAKVLFNNATVNLSSAPTGKFTLAEATGTGTFVGVPNLTCSGGLNGYEPVLSNDGKKIEIKKRTGVKFLVF